MNRFRPERSVLDHFLASLGGLFATYSVAMSVGKDHLAITLAGAVVALSILGFLIAKLLGPARSESAGWFLGVLGIAAVIGTRRLNGYLPEEGFPFELLAASSLTFLILLGCLFAWSDGILLFLSLPTIAIFGLVGTFDAYRPGVFLFFVFMVGEAVLYARVHQRVMMARAKKLGADVNQLRKGPWRWMAGPEWALASAGLIILLSLLGAPVLQTSLSGVSAAVRVTLPSAANNARKMLGTATAQEPIGRGAVKLSESPLFLIELDKPRYLRRQAFVTYTSSGWSDDIMDAVAGEDRQPVSISADTYQFGPSEQVNLERLTHPKKITITIVPIQYISDVLPSPGPVVGIRGPLLGLARSSGALRLLNPLQPGFAVTYFALVPTEQPLNATSRIPDVYSGMLAGRSLRDRRAIPTSVYEAALAVAKDAQTPYEKAMAITKWVGDRCKYNTKVAAVPSGRDPVDYFLNTSQEGYCDLFASSVVLMCRSVGLTARYTTGFLMNGPVNPNTGQYTVREKDGHAWAEVYFEGSGWLPFDATEFATAVEGGERGQTPRLVNFWEQPWFRGLAAGIGAFLGALCLIIIGPRIFRRDGSGPLEARSPILKRQTRFQGAIQNAVGHPRRFSDTLREYVIQQGDHLGPTLPGALELVSVFEYQMFSSVGPDHATLKSLDAQVGEFRKQLNALQKSKRGRK